MNISSALKKILTLSLDQKKYKKNNPDVSKDYSIHYDVHGFEEARPAFFFDKKNKVSKLNHVLDIQYLKSERSPNIEIIPEYFNGTPSPCSYIRLIFPLQYLDFLSEINLNEENKKNKLWALNRVPNFSVDLEEWLSSLNYGDRILYDLDDDLLAHYGSSSKESKIIAKMLAVADVVTVSTKAIQKIIFQINKNAVLRKNFCLTELTSTTRNFDNEMSILFMGTSTHNEDFEFIYEALVCVAKKNPTIKFNVIGIDNFDKFQNINNINITTSYYPQFIKKYQKIGNFKIGIIPLIDNKINNSKSNIKYYDYLNNCQYILCSNIGEYRNLKLPRLFTVNNMKNEWVESLQKIIDLPLINNEEIVESYISAKKVKFEELFNLSRLINLTIFSNKTREFNHSSLKLYLSEFELNELIKARFLKKQSLNVNNFTMGEKLKLILEEEKEINCINIENFIYLNQNLEIILKQMQEKNANYIIIVNIINYDKKDINNITERKINRSTDKLSIKSYLINKLIDEELNKVNFLNKYQSSIYINNIKYLKLLLKINNYNILKINYKNFQTYVITN